MTQIVLLLVLGVGQAFAMPTEKVIWQGEEREVVSGEVLVTAQGGLDQQMLVEEQFPDSRSVLPLVMLKGQSVYRVRLTEGSSLEAVLRANSQPVTGGLKSAVSQTEVQPNFVYRVPGLADLTPLEVAELSMAPRPIRGREVSEGGYRWDLEAMGVREAHRLMTEHKAWKPETTVAVLDTGFFSKHQLLQNSRDPYSIYAVTYFNGGKVFTSRKEYEPAVKGTRINPQTGRFEEYSITGGWHDWVGHGTHVSGTIAASESSSLSFRGVAPGYTILPVKILDDEGTGSTSLILQGMYYAKEKGAGIFNMSLGGSGRDPLAERVHQEMERKGIVVVAAAGNDFERGNPTFYPAAYPSTLAVGSLGSDGWLSYFSESGSWVDVAAPGGDGHKPNRGRTHRQIFSTFTADPRAHKYETNNPKESGEDGRSFVGMSGTSMATPHVAGAIALLRSVRPDLSLTAIRTLLQSTGSKIQGAYHARQLVETKQARAVRIDLALAQLFGEGGGGDGGNGETPPAAAGKDLVFEANGALASGAVLFEQGVYQRRPREEYELTAAPGQKRDFANAKIAELSFVFPGKVPGARPLQGSSLSLYFRIQGRPVKGQPVVLSALTEGQPYELWSGEVPAAKGGEIRVSIQLEKGEKNFTLRVRESGPSDRR